MPLATDISSCAVLLADARYGQCRSIIGYINGCCSSAMICARPVVAPVVTESGVTVEYSWCAQHKAAYMHDPANPVRIPTYCR